jgi:hypothetical protein
MSEGVHIEKGNDRGGFFDIETGEAGLQVSKLSSPVVCPVVGKIITKRGYAL